LSSCIGGLYVSFRPITVGPKRLTAGVLLLAFALTLQPLAWASSPLWLGASLLIASLPLVPLTGLLSSLIEVHAGPNNRGTLFAVFVTASMVGAGTGVSLAGIISTTLSPNAPALVSSAAFAMLGLAVLTQVAWRSFVHRRDRAR
jgi:predicted MFS family arabinose efflux permease